MHRQYELIVVIILHEVLNVDQDITVDTNSCQNK